MGEKVTSNFPAMGEHPLEGSVVNMSGQRSPYTMERPKNQGKNAGPDSSDSVKSATLIQEAHGPQCKPMTTIAYPNSPEAGATGRNLRIMPSAVGNRDFWAARAQAGGDLGGS